MDIQEAREAFEDWIKNEDPFVGNDAAPDCIWAKKYMWKAWQAAKTQAVPEGFVLVSKDTLNKALNPNDYDEAVCSANELLAVIEAQEKNQ